MKQNQDRRQAKHELHTLIEDGLQSGISTKTAEDIRQDVLTRLKADD